MNLAVSELSRINIAVRLTKQIEKIIKQNEFVNKWYELGNVKIFLNTSSLLVLVEVIRIVEVSRISDDSNMDKQTKDKITKFLKKNKCIYSELHDAYVYGGLRETTKMHNQCMSVKRLLNK